MGTGMTAWHTGNAGVVIQVTNIEEKGCAAIGFDVFAKQPAGFTLTRQRRSDRNFCGISGKRSWERWYLPMSTRIISARRTWRRL